MGKRSAVVELFLGDMGSMQRELRPSTQREDQLTMETKLEQIAVKAVNQLPKSVVREIRTPRSVGAGGGRPPPATRWMWKRSHCGTIEAPPGERGGNRYVLPNANAPHLDSTRSAGDGTSACGAKRSLRSMLAILRIAKVRRSVITMMDLRSCRAGGKAARRLRAASVRCKAR